MLDDKESLSDTTLDRLAVKIEQRRRPTGAMQHIADTHERTPLWLKLVLGTGFIVFGAFLIYQTPPADKLQMAWEGGIIAAGLLILPGVGKGILDAIRPFLPWSKNGVSGEPKP